MDPEKVVYGQWDGNATVLATYPDGCMAAFEYQERSGWVSVHPADVATKAGVLKNADFKAMFPKAQPLPSLTK